MSEVLRRAGRALLPRRYHRSTRLERVLESKIAGRIQAGPFASLQYVDRSFGSVYWPKVLGTYELELREILEELMRVHFRTVLVAGSAEGYYAVGIATRLPQARIVAWEANEEARATMAQLAVLNHVAERVEARAICDFGELTEALQREGPHLVIADLDGGEAALLDPAAVPELREVWIVAETHDCFVPGVATLLKRRFARSHIVDAVAARPRSFSDAPPLAVPPHFNGALAQLMSERRPPGNDWLVMTPRSNE
jgi:hypothetical protein